MHGNKVQKLPKGRNVPEDNGLRGLRPTSIANLFDRSCDAKPFFIELGFVADNEDFDAEEGNFERAGLDAISGFSRRIVLDAGGPVAASCHWRHGQR